MFVQTLPLKVTLDSIAVSHFYLSWRFKCLTFHNLPDAAKANTPHTHNHTTSAHFKGEKLQIANTGRSVCECMRIQKKQHATHMHTTLPLFYSLLMKDRGKVGKRRLSRQRKEERGK